METKNRPHAAAIAALKSKIKALAAIQRPLKRLRKTLLPEAERSSLLVRTGTTEWSGLDPEDLSHRAWSLVERRRLEITAALNLRHELRGSALRHGVQDLDRYHYDKAIAALREEVTR